MRKLLVVITTCAVLVLMGHAAGAATWFDTLLDGDQEVPANTSPGLGFGSVLLNDLEDLITVNLWWQNLTTAPTAAHIHGPAGPGVNGPIVFTLTGVPAATTGSIPEQSFAISQEQVNWLKSGLLYFNIHTSQYPGGEIRGDIHPVPEPGGLIALGVGLVGLAAAMKRGR